MKKTVYVTGALATSSCRMTSATRSLERAGWVPRAPRGTAPEHRSKLPRDWRFVAPGPYANEKKFAVPFVLLTTIGAVGGPAFSHYILFPYLIAFFGTFSSADLAFMPRVGDAFDLYTKMMLGMVVVFR